MQTYYELGEAEARLAIDVCVAALSARGKAGVVAVGDRHGELIGLLRMDGAPLPSILVAINKVFTTSRKGEPSGNIGRANQASGDDISYYGDPRFVGWDGGAPVILAGQVLGSVAVSGLSGAEDLEIAEMGVSQILAHLAVKI